MSRNKGLIEVFVARAHGVRGLFAALPALAALVFAAPAAATAPAPAWAIHSLATPSRLSSEDNTKCNETVGQEHSLCDAYQVTATDVGGAGTQTGATVTLEDTLPSEVTAQRIILLWTGPEAIAQGRNREDLGSASLVEVRCVVATVTCTFPALEPDESLEMIILVTVSPPGTTGSATNSATVAGGGAAQASTTSTNAIGGQPPAFGIAELGTYDAGLDGLPDTQAGSHPYEFTARIDLNSEFRVGPDAEMETTSVEDPRDVVVDLPLGFLGSARSTPTCTFAELDVISVSGTGGCPTDTIVGKIASEPATTSAIEGPIFNMAPARGDAAEFGFTDGIEGTHAFTATVVPTPAGYVLRTVARELPQIRLTDIVTTFFGSPAEKDASGLNPVASFTNPSECSGQALPTTAFIDSWQHPGAFTAAGEPDLHGPGWASVQSATLPEGVTGCDLLQFNPTLSAQPEADVPGAADAPAGLNFTLDIPQFEDPATLATPPLREAVVTLPADLTVDPAAAGGLQACSEQQIGFEGFDSASETNEFSAEAPSCPEASQIGSVELTTPLLPTTLHGSIYLAAQYENPFHSLMAGYIVVDDPTTGIIVKIAGELEANEQTGQIKGVFKNNPQFPFSELALHFKGGERGVLATPESCGTYTTASRLEPWSAPDSGPPATPSSDFSVYAGCVSGFAPSFAAGTISPQAGTFSPFTLSFGREDDEQGLGGLTVSLPPGLLGKIAGVSECSEAAIAAAAQTPGRTEQASPSCPESSLLGTVTAATGPGPQPYSVSGEAYLTGPYKGAPYGVAVIVPAVAGPFDLGTVVIRQALYIDPNDAHVTDVSDPFPTILKGIPLRIKHVSVTLDRPGFTLNPTSCDTKAITATATSTSGTRAPLDSRFQAGGCQGLPFTPKLTASVAGKASKADGATFKVHISSAGIGQATVAKVDLTLPEALPSRQSTLDKACLDHVFEVNPAACPEASSIGYATVRTPLLNVPLTGPGYLVSHGAAAFPDVEFVLQGEQITLILDGKTDIKKGITYSRFESSPDAPFTTFEAAFPAGPHSILTANVPEKEDFNLCKAARSMPTEIVGHNGAVIRQTTKISVSGCAKTRTRAQQLAAALKACKKDKRKTKRQACEKTARKKYGTKAARHTSKGRKK